MKALRGESEKKKEIGNERRNFKPVVMLEKSSEHEEGIHFEQRIKSITKVEAGGERRPVVGVVVVEFLRGALAWKHKSISVIAFGNH